MFEKLIASAPAYSHSLIIILEVIYFFPFSFFFQYAQETQHEKILRGLAVGIAFTMYARLEEADPLVTSLSTDKDPVLRRSGMYTLAMAYCGTGNNKAIRKLLHIAVSKDTSIIITIIYNANHPEYFDLNGNVDKVFFCDGTSLKGHEMNTNDESVDNDSKNFSY